MSSLALFAQLGNLPMLVFVVIVVVLMFFFGIITMFVRYFKRCPSNRVLVIYGKSGTEAATCVHGGARFVWPVVQAYAWLNLEPMQIEIPLRGALSMENIRVNVPSVFTVAIGTTPELMQNAAIRLLGLGGPEIRKQAEDIIFGQLRQVIASMLIEDINRDRDLFLGNITGSLEPELRKIGLILINVNITDITDESGYIEAIGKKAASQAIQKARGDVADNEKMGETRVAEAEREKAVQVAIANKAKAIGTREAERDQAISIASMDKEQQVGEQQAAFEQEAQVRDAEREKRIRVAEANARAVEGENMSKAAIAASQAELMVKEAEAFQTGQTRQRQAKAAVLEAEHIAMAKAAEAEAREIEAKRRAELEAPAKAEKARTIVEAEAVAERRRLEAEGEAKAIYARLEAEARGQYEVLAKKGEGLKQIIDACGGAEQAFKMLMLEHFDNLVEASAKAISNIKFDKVVVWEGNGHNGTTATANWLQNMARTLPPMMQVMKEIGGVEIPDTLVNLGERESSQGNGVEKDRPQAEVAKPQDHSQ